jgi:hypothetical protein
MRWCCAVATQPYCRLGDGLRSFLTILANEPYRAGHRGADERQPNKDHHGRPQCEQSILNSKHLY